MKQTWKSTFIGILLITALTGCTSQPSPVENFPNSRQALITFHEEISQATDELSTMMMREGIPKQRYDYMWQSVHNLSITLEEELRELKTVPSSEMAEACLKNTIIIGETTQQILENIKEASAQGRGLVRNGNFQTSQIQEIDRLLNGYSIRLTKTKDKFTQLQEALQESCRAY